MSPERESAEDLLARGREDLGAAEALLDTPAAVRPLAGLCQAACEKALKAVLASRGVEYPLTHDLIALVREIGKLGLEIQIEERVARRLTEAALGGRYRAGEFEDLTREEAVASARSVVDQSASLVGEID